MNRSFVKDSVLFGIGNALIRSVNIALVPVLTRALTVGEYGIYELFFSLVALLELVLGLGLDRSLIRYYHDYRRKGRASALLVTTFLVPLFVTSVIFIISTPFARWLTAAMFGQRGRQALVWLLVLMTILRVGVNQVSAYYRIRNEARKYIALNLRLVLTILPPVLLVATWMHGSVESVLVAFSIAYGLNLVYILVRDYRLRWLEFEINIVWRSVRFGFPLILSALAWFFINSSDRLFLVHYRGADELGIYALAYRVISLVPLFIITPFQLALYPAVFRMEGQAEQSRFLGSLLLPLATTLFIASLGLSAVAGPLVHVLASSQYNSAAVVVTWLAPSTMFVGLYYWAAIAFHIVERPEVITVAAGAAAVVNVVLNALLIPTMGILGAAVSTVVSTFLVFMGLFLKGTKTLKNLDVDRTKLLWLLALAAATYSSLYLTAGVRSALAIHVGLVMVSAVLVWWLELVDRAAVRFYLKKIRTRFGMVP